MANPCPKCNNELRPGAKFCDTCGAPVEGAPDAPGTAPAPPAATAAPGSVNWTAILIVVLIIAVLGWLLFGNNSGNQATNMAGAGANPHATGSQDNPHAGMDSGMQMEDITNQIEDSKERLDKDPLDIEALSAMYQIYGMIDRQGQVTPYTEAALSALEEQQDSLGEEKVDEMLRGIITAALGGRDFEGGLLAMEQYARIDPDNTQTLAMLGNLNYDLGNHGEAIEWYDKYIELADPVADAETYWNVRADRATMFVNRYMESDDEADLQTALAELQEITTEQPSHWGAWFNLGQANIQAGETELAEAAFEQAKTLAQDPMQIWQVERELALLRGEEPPPMPGNEGNPHGGMGMGGMGSAEGMPNPHGGTESSGGGGNPHGGMGGA